ncbi:MAG: FkbM family methyltransferase [Leptolyngbyaceae cyanobacterium bins.349]|nr:FkbM family methyltransferase [Leptolyngbyaceae cyanobacterium bins.349]
MSSAYNKQLIFDIGMHIGQDTDFYLAKGFKVIAIEANPLLVQEAEVKFAEPIKNQHLKILNVGIDDKNGEFSFYVNDTYSEWSSFIKEIGERGGIYHEITVPCVTMDKIFAQYGVPYYLKVDIEGNDIQVVKHLHTLKQKPKYVSVENGNEGLLETLHEAGYTQFKFINQAKVSEMKCPKPSLEGKDVDYQFAMGSSGPFGEETVGTWKSYEQVAQEIEAYWSIPDRDANIHGWYDLHAKWESSNEWFGFKRLLKFLPG